jgi:osmotically-inducible protein OsmY
VQASRDAVNGVGSAIDDTGISLKVKTALAADPALSASRIEVTTTNGVVRLEGPAPDPAAKERATVLAGAPQGVRGVDNRLALPQPSRVVAIADGATQQPVSPAASMAR